jgi:aldehyde dehydrogenase (NAD+)
MELGGKSANIVFADADLKLAVPGAAMAVFGNSGQSCSAGSRLFVQREIYDTFVAQVASYARSLRLGHPLDPQTQLGPLVSEEQLNRVTGFLESGIKEGARAAAGGSRAKGDGLDRGYYVEPTVFADVDDSMRIAREEIFGPVIAAIPFDDGQEAVRRANASEYGLGGGVWTRSMSNAHIVSRGLRTGSVWVNCYQVMDPSMPFGGYKMSGFGRESGSEHIEEFLQTKSVWVETAGSE